MSKSFSIKFPSIGCSEPKAFDRLSTDYGKLRAESVQALRATGVQDAESHLETLAITKLATARKEGFPEDWKTKHSLTYGGALLSQLLDAATEMLPAQEHTAFALKAFNLLEELATSQKLEGCRTGPSEWTTLVFSSDDPTNTDSWKVERVDG